MIAIGHEKCLPIDNPDALREFRLPDPTPRPRDLLVEVKAVSVNPVDVKVRANLEPEGGPRVLGWDASGVVRSVGSEITLFKPGDEVYYAGALDRPGTNSSLHVVDERIVGRKPERLTYAEAAALPLTTITAWELLFDRFGIVQGKGDGDAILVIGGAGGVGSILIQLARALTRLTVVATASRTETQDWVNALGAHYVIDHREDMVQQMSDLGIEPCYVAGLTDTDQHFPAIAEMMAPQGKFGLVDDPDPKSVNVMLIKQKAISIHWEFMFTRSLFETPDMIEQHKLLSSVADLVDAGTIKTTARHDAGEMTIENLRAAHDLQESGRAIGKTTLTLPE